MSESIKRRMSAVKGRSDAFHHQKLWESARTELVALRTLANELKALVNNIRATFTSNLLLTRPALAIGSTDTAVSSALFYYSIGGAVYVKAAVATGTAPGNDVIPQSKYGAVAFDIGSDGTIDAIEAAANATGYTSAALAVAGLPAAATGHVRIGYVTAMKSDGAFTFGTTALSAANTTVAYTDSGTVFSTIAALSAASSSDTSEYLAE